VSVVEAHRETSVNHCGLALPFVIRRMTKVGIRPDAPEVCDL
jgi:hypothetical protein